MKALVASELIINYFNTIDEMITNKKLQKLLYYVESWFLVHKTSIIEEDFEAWVHGPVIPSVYFNYKSFGFSPINGTVTDDKSVYENRIKNILIENDIDSDSENLFFQILGRYGSMSSFDLETLSHFEKPWKLARASSHPFESISTVIDKGVMKEYYTSLIHA